MVPKERQPSLESIVESDRGNRSILKKVKDYATDNQLLTTGVVLWLPRLSLIALYSTEIEKSVGDDIADKIEYISWMAASLSYLPWGLHGAGLRTYNAAWEHRKEHGWMSLGLASIKGIGEYFRFLCWDMPKYVICEAPQYLTHWYNKKIKKKSLLD